MTCSPITAVVASVSSVMSVSAVHSACDASADSLRSSAFARSRKTRASSAEGGLSCSAVWAEMEESATAKNSEAEIKVDRMAGSIKLWLTKSCVERCGINTVSTLGQHPAANFALIKPVFCIPQRGPSVLQKKPSAFKGMACILRCLWRTCQKHPPYRLQIP